jgi:hypothetical protein
MVDLTIGSPRSGQRVVVVDQSAAQSKSRQLSRCRMARSWRRQARQRARRREQP